jgi:hypothetical protein
MRQRCRWLVKRLRCIRIQLLLLLLLLLLLH